VKKMGKKEFKEGDNVTKNEKIEKEHKKGKLVLLGELVFLFICAL
jgi:hypothetical protein